jgi:hypothetical protein
MHSGSGSFGAEQLHFPHCFFVSIAFLILTVYESLFMYFMVRSFNYFPVLPKITLVFSFLFFLIALDDFQEKPEMPTLCHYFET